MNIYEEINEIPDEPIAPDIFTYIIGKYILNMVLV